MEDDLKIITDLNILGKHGQWIGSLTMKTAMNDSLLYDKYKNDIEVSEDKIIDMEILSILDRLGFPMNELGTYLYKDVISSTYENIRNCKDESDILNIMADLKYRYSNAYSMIARDGYEMGIKTFHRFVEDAVKKIDEDKIDIAFFDTIFDETSEHDTGSRAFEIASYLIKEDNKKSKTLIRM